MIKYPYISKQDIESTSIHLLEDYQSKTGNSVSSHIDVLDMIEFLGYDIDFRKDGLYQDPNYLGGLHYDKKLIEINELLTEQEGRLHFTAAHEIGHIILHVPLLERLNDKSKILCRKDEGFAGTKRVTEEWQADTFAAYLLMPRKRVTDAFKKVSSSPITLKNKWFLNLFMKTRSTRQRAVWLAEKVINIGGFDNVSKLAMTNRLIGLGLIKGLTYQKNLNAI